MRTRRRIAAIVIVFVVHNLVLGHREVDARVRYQEAFIKYYPDLKDQAESAKCKICHPEERKKVRNDYGIELRTALGGKNITGAKEIEAALKKSEEGKSSVEGKTFGDLIKEGKLPGTNPPE